MLTRGVTPNSTDNIERHFFHGHVYKSIKRCPPSAAIHPESPAVFVFQIFRNKKPTESAEALQKKTIVPASTGQRFLDPWYRPVYTPLRSEQRITFGRLLGNRDPVLTRPAGGEPTVGEEQSNLLFAREYYDAIDADDGMMVSVCFCFVFSNAGIMVLVFAKFNRKCS